MMLMLTLSVEQKPCLQGVPKKVSHVWEAIAPPKMALGTKLGGFFKSSGTPLSDGHRNFSFLTMGGEKIGFKESNPISKNTTKLTFPQVQVFWV